MNTSLPSINSNQSIPSIFMAKKPSSSNISNINDLPKTNLPSPTNTYNRASLTSLKLQSSSVKNLNTNTLDKNIPELNYNLSQIQPQNINFSPKINQSVQEYLPVQVQTDLSVHNLSISEDILNLALYTLEMSFNDFNKITIESLLLLPRTVPHCWAINILIYYKQQGNPIKIIDKKYVK